MSQVVITNDKYKSRRDASKNQEHKIDKESRFSRWRRNDISKGADPVEKIVGILSLPIFAFWGLICAVGGAALWVSIQLCKLFAKLIPKTLSK